MEAAWPCQHCHLSGQELEREAIQTVGVLQRHSKKQTQSLQPSGRREDDFCELSSPKVFYDFTVLYQCTSFYKQPHTTLP